MSLVPPSLGSVELTAFQQHVRKTLSSGDRLDGRQRDAHRDVRITRNVVEGALSSSIVGLGASAAQCVVRGTFGPPMPSHPRDGRLEFRVDLAFVPRFSDQVRDANKLLSHFLRQSLEHLLSTEALCVLPGEACWVIEVDVVVLSADGNLRSLCFFAAAAALQHVLLPRSRLPNGDVTNEIVWGLPNTAGVVAVGAALVDGVAYLDPSSAEDSVADAHLTAVIDVKSVREPKLVFVAHHGGTLVAFKTVDALVRDGIRQLDAFGALTRSD